MKKIPSATQNLRGLPHQRLREKIAGIIAGRKLPTGFSRLRVVYLTKADAILSAVAEEVEAGRRDIKLGTFMERKYTVGELIEEKTKGYLQALDDLLRRLK